MKNIKLLVVNPVWPCPAHSKLSANIIIFELIRELAKQQGVEVSFLKINKFDEQLPSKEQEEGIEAMKSLGVDVLSPFNMPQFNKRRAKWLRSLSPRFNDFYPGAENMGQIKDVIMVHGADVLFIPLSEWATALCCDVPIIKFAYYSNPDPKQAFAMTRFNWRTGQSNFFRWIAQEMAYRKLEEIHLNTMRKYELLGNVAANDAKYYVSHGHPNAFYIQNVWIDRCPDWREVRKGLKTDVPVIIGSVGNLGATANTHGFEILGRDILPHLKKIMGDEKYEVHIIGSGEMSPAVVKYFDRPEVRIRGFVQDIDNEMMAAKVFLCANNASNYQVVHTRYLHAWSLGCCVVAHKDAALSKPEMVHNENSLLGKNPAEIAEFVKRAIEDEELRRKMGENGYKTFKQYFIADKVAPKIVQKIRDYMHTHA